MTFSQKLKELGLTLPEVAKPVAAYIPAVRTDSIVYSSGQLPMAAGTLKYKGRMGDNISLEEADEAARMCAMNALAAVCAEAGGIDAIERIVRVTGYVNSTPEFTEQPKVVNGASELMLAIFGDAGRHARSAVGVSSLPLGAPVEVELIVKLK